MMMGGSDLYSTEQLKMGGHYACPLQQGPYHKMPTSHAVMKPPIYITWSTEKKESSKFS
jgi:hypothetical protein